jgi:hypothetical protein
MLISEEKLELQNAIFALEKRIDEMHEEFQKYYQGDSYKVPEWERLEMDLVHFSRRKIIDLQLSQQLDRVLHKFQGRKRTWLRWVEMARGGPGR